MNVKKFAVYGRVQGVGFRYFTWKEATKIGLTGWVKNRSDGSVLVIAKGSEQQLTQLYQWLQRGSPSAVVKQVIMEDYLGDAVFHDFSVRRT
ncbi:acylphosphatase [Avibacterium sp. 20-15]|uniref:acylphosphatase n=1 Tax=unclassified Avibacterium TaxID=2685287 RepID=UPI002026F018|nr:MULTISPECIES: acylphosphatase [unclassified Avibacterium]MCW9733773.1 acylphosphatase [Avibacterium sp. 20-15]URL02928.1 acylphosphatase [Avibacterium sp. 20-126]URL04061.1 acylphosphatase [Avibacterium sp. 20-132]